MPAAIVNVRFVARLAIRVFSIVGENARDDPLDKFSTVPLEPPGNVWAAAQGFAATKVGRTAGLMSSTLPVSVRAPDPPSVIPPAAEPHLIPTVAVESAIRTWPSVPTGKRALAVENVKRSPFVVNGDEPPPIEAQPVAFPFARMPVGACPVEQSVGVPANELAVAALPVVLWFRVGMSPAMSVRPPTVVPPVV